MRQKFVPQPGQTDLHDFDSRWDMIEGQALIARCDATILRRQGQGYFIPRELVTGKEIEDKGFGKSDLDLHHVSHTSALVLNIGTDRMFAEIPACDRTPLPDELQPPIGTVGLWVEGGEAMQVVVTEPFPGYPFPRRGKEGGYVPFIQVDHQACHEISVVAQHMEEGYMVCRDVRIRGSTPFGQ